MVSLILLVHFVYPLVIPHSVYNPFDQLLQSACPLDDYESWCALSLSLRSECREVGVYVQTFKFWVKVLSGFGFGVSLILWYKHVLDQLGFLEVMETASFIIELSDEHFFRATCICNMSHLHSFVGSHWPPLSLDRYVYSMFLDFVIETSAHYL